MSNRLRNYLLPCVLTITALLIGVGLIGCTSDDSSTTTENMNAIPNKPREGTVQSIQRADEDLQAETTVHDYRIGATLLESQDIYDGSEITSPDKNGNRQLRILLRDQRTKRYLPGADVEVTFRGTETDSSQSPMLLETWGPYHFYGLNLNIPEEATELAVSVQAPRVGRHADMKERHRRAFQVKFPLKRDDDEALIQGSDPKPVADDVTIGSNITKGLDEASSLVEAGTYRVAFLAEHSEPFWIPAEDDRSQEESLSLVPADIPQSANRHLEILLYDRDTNRSIPHADVHLNLSDGDEIETRTNLPFLMAEFYHYGNSLYLPKSDYTVKATMGSPELHTLEENRFPDKEQATFSWSSASGEEGKEYKEY